MSDDTGTEQQQAPTPNPDLEGLNRLVGTWNVTGGADSTTCSGAWVYPGGGGYEATMTKAA
jgi:hypothetical protein